MTRYAPPRHRRFAVLLLALALLLTGCGGGRQEPAPLDPDQYGPGEYPYEMTTFDRMAYRRPDMDALEALFTEAADLADEATSDDTEALTALVERCWDAYDEFYTMGTLAMLRSDIDQSDEAMMTEYEFCQDNEIRMDELLDRLLVACAGSRAKVPSYLLAGYDQGDAVPYTDRQLELMNREGVLLVAYWRAMMLDEIRLNGETVSYLDVISDPYITDEAYQEARLAYARACNEAAAPIYIELIRVRRDMADAFGYDSYEAMQYDSFLRDYTPEQVKLYLRRLADTFAGPSRQLLAADPYSLISYDSLSPSALLAWLHEAVSGMGERVNAAYDFMEEYELYDVYSSASKAPGAYTIYLDSYAAPFVFLGAYGDVEDFLDLSHEFGHFVDAYVNYNATGSLDLAEMYSQAMANLAVLRSRDDLGDDAYRNLLLIHLVDMLNVFTEQAAYADFESQAYSLPDEELTVENLNALALACGNRFGSVAPGDEELTSLYWAQVTHLFESPFYIISYCVSADTAAQIAALEYGERGAGVAVYEDLLDWETDSLLSEAERVGLESPFSPGRSASNLTFILQLLDDVASRLSPAA